MFFKKGDNRGFFRKAVDAGHLGLKILSHPIVHTVANGLFGENSLVGKASGVLQKLR